LEVTGDPTSKSTTRRWQRAQRSSEQNRTFMLEIRVCKEPSPSLGNTNYRLSTAECSLTRMTKGRGRRGRGRRGGPSHSESSVVPVTPTRQSFTFPSCILHHGKGGARPRLDDTTRTTSTEGYDTPRRVTWPRLDPLSFLPLPFLRPTKSYPDTNTTFLHPPILLPRSDSLNPRFI
ncbi:hypothetical protein BC629DRAFT_1521936, partial [Irpex lacteus]